MINNKILRILTISASVIIILSQSIKVQASQLNPLSKVLAGEALASSIYTSRNANEAGNIIFIGDSRTVCMHNVIGDAKGTVWSAEVGQGFSWLESTGYPSIEPFIQDNSKVVIWLGVNDTKDIDSYISYYNSLSSELSKSGSKLYVVNIGPVDESVSTNSIHNSSIESFNKSLLTNLDDSISYIDIYSALKNHGYVTADGLHYQNGTSKYIYNYIHGAVNKWYHSSKSV